MAVVGMAALEVPAGDEATGLDTELNVEGMQSVAIFNGEAGKQAASSLPRWCFLFSSIDHGLNGNIPDGRGAGGSASAKTVAASAARAGGGDCKLRRQRGAA